MKFFSSLRKREFSDTQLALSKFYMVGDKDALIDKMELHIDRLQNRIWHLKRLLDGFDELTKPIRR